MSEISKEEALALASHACKQCYGAGIIDAAWQKCACAVLRIPKPEAWQCESCHGRRRYIVEFAVCKCVYRAIFRSVWEQYQSVEHGSGGSLYTHESRGCSRPSEEFVADVELVARRALSGDLLDVFNVWVTCGPHIDLYQSVCLKVLRCTERAYRLRRDKVQIACARAWRDVRPYALHPVIRYFDEHYTAPVYVLPAKTFYVPVRAPLDPRGNRRAGVDHCQTQCSPPNYQLGDHSTNKSPRRAA